MAFPRPESLPLFHVERREWSTLEGGLWLRHQSIVADRALDAKNCVRTMMPSGLYRILDDAGHEVSRVDTRTKGES